MPRTHDYHYVFSAKNMLVGAVSPPLRAIDTLLLWLECKIFARGHVTHVDCAGIAPGHPSSMTDNELAKRAKEDVESFSELFDRFFTPVYRFFFIRLRHVADSEDLTSETLEKMFTKIHTFEERGLPFSAWVFRIARNNLNDHLRRKRMETVPLEEMDESSESAHACDLQKFDDKILTEKLWEAVARLPEKQQQIWALKLSADLPHKEIAEVLGMTENSVNVSIHRSFSALKSYLVKTTQSS